MLCSMHTPPQYVEGATVSLPSPAERHFTVQGMTCGHCVASVSEEVSEVAGVSAVAVDLASGRMTVAGAGVDDAAVRAAVAEAGYAVAS
jgi:copper chaperone CopZ